MIEAITSTIIMYYIIGILLSYTLFFRIVKIKEIETGMKVILFLTIPFIFIVRGILEYFAGDIVKTALDIALFAFWIVMLVALIKRTKGIDRITMTFFLALTGTFGAMLILSTIKQKKTKILKDKFVVYTKNILGKAIDTFKQIDKSYLFTLLLDIAFYAAIALIFMGFIAMITKTASGIEPIKISADMMSSQQAQAYTTAAYSMLYKMLALLIALLILFTILITFFKGMIWKIVRKAKLQQIHFIKLFLLNTMLIVVILTLFVALSMMSTKGFGLMIAAMTILMLIIAYTIHYTTIINYTFMDEKKIFSTLGKSFMKSIRLHKFIMPNLIFLIITIIINLIISIFSFAGETATMIISGTLMLLSIAWFRFYISKVLKDV